MAKKIAIVHPKLGWGGSEAIVFQAIMALKDEYDVSLISTGKIDIPRINEYYDTNLTPGDFSFEEVPLPFVFKKTEKFAAFRGSFVQRYCQRRASQFDVMIGAYNLCNFKTRGIQFVVDIEELPKIIEVRGFKRLWYGKTILRKIYLKLCDLISPTNPGEWKNNYVVAISNWTAELAYQKYNLRAEVIYPPVTDDLPALPYNKRENGFIFIGRIVPEKRLESAINILHKVRQRDGYNIHLHVVGAMDNSRYSRLLRHRIMQHKDWIFVENGLSNKEKKELIAHHRFGISCRKNEPFGIAVAEMAKSGCIVFVSDGGGQKEIVADDRLAFKDEDDAAQKIQRVLNSASLQSELVDHLSHQSRKFSTEKFRQSVRKIVVNFLKENGKSKNKQ